MNVLPLPPGVACYDLAVHDVACNLFDDLEMAANVNQRVQKHRDALRRAGLRPVQIWVPDTRRPDFAQGCRRQCLLVAQADRADTAMQQCMDEALADVDGWTA
ncbi:MAG: antitoxin MazE family protein [Tepidimonas sp.]|nr:antitoxin MazE family protein [Tepidimonas sp.]